MRLKRILAFVVVILAITAYLLYRYQAMLVFHPSTTPQVYGFHFSKPFAEKRFDFAGNKMHAVYFAAKTPSKTTILYLHGNAGSLSSWGNVAAEQRDTFDVNVWMVDYPGFGKSEGSVDTQAQLLGVTDAFYEFVHKTFPEQQFIIWGRSIGTGPAAYLASKVAPLALVLESPYQNFSRIADEAAPWFPKFLRGFDLPIDEWLKGAKYPVLIVHGKKDDVIRFTHTEALMKLYPSYTYLILDDAGHNDLSEFDAYWVALKQFVARVRR